MDNSKIRLHIPAIPYTITRPEFSHDAFTGKVLRFSRMMRSRGFEVYHYGVETSVSEATKQFDIMTKEEWTELRIKSWQFIHKDLTLENAIKMNNDDTQVVSQLSNWSSPLTKEFNARFRKHLIENYRSNKTDIVCIPLARTYQDALDKLNYVVVEIGIGYSGSYLNYRIFESYLWMANTLGKEDKQPNNYWFVIPHFFDTKEFQLSLKPMPKRIGYLGRITELKGCKIIMEIARKFPDYEFVICGQGDPTPYLSVPNIVYKKPIHGSERSEYLGSCIAFLHLAKYLEPFGCGPVEAQLCGTPVISTDWGGMVETVEQGITGLRGHTLADFCYGVQMAIDGKFNRQYIRDRAVRLYDMYNVARQYDYVFRTILDVHIPGKNGWYSPDTHIPSLLTDKPSDKQARIYICIPYYGAFPNYFQLYLDSLGINTDIITVFLITDIDMTPYACPDNLVVIKMSKVDVQKRASKFILEAYNKVVEPENLLKDNYKFVDFKIVYPLIFDDILRSNGVTREDYVGWGDIDLIYGKLSNFIDFKEDYGILGGWHGHFTAIKNTDSFKNNFKTIPNFLELITDNSRTFITDEIAYREPLKAYLANNNIKMFYANAYFCDIVPECFYHLSRPDHASWKKNFYDLYNSKKNIKHLLYDKSKLTVFYDDGSSREALYCHLQKRKMDYSFKLYDKYYILENSFCNDISVPINNTLLFKKLTSLKMKGYNPDLIFDIGAHKGSWTRETIRVFPDSQYYLFEANNYDELNKLSTKTNIKVFPNILLNSDNVEVPWFNNSSTGDSIFKEKTHFYTNINPLTRKSVKLDHVLKDDMYVKNARHIFIKIDCQGAEIPILKGAQEIASKADFILLEIPFFGKYNEGIPSFMEHIQYMDSIGFIPYDLIEEHIIKTFTIQIDILFIKKTHELNTLVQTALLTNTIPVIKNKPNKHITVITYCSGYDYNTFNRFAGTLYDTGFSGDLIFVIQEKDKDVLEKLKVSYKNVSYFVDNVVNPRHCQQKRYYIYKNILDAGINTDYVLLCDSRDIFFQKNIEDFPLDTSVDVFFFKEDRNIGNCHVNKEWLGAIEKELNIDIISTVADKRIICSGATIGKLNGIKNYVNRMCDLMSNKIHTEFTKFTGFDQGIHNYLIYIEGFPDMKVHLFANRDNLVNNLQYGEIRFINEYNKIVNLNKEESYIVHQWDRLADYMRKRFNGKYKFY